MRLNFSLAAFLGLVLSFVGAVPAGAGIMIGTSLSDTQIYPDGFVFSYTTQFSDDPGVGNYMSASLGVPDGTLDNVEINFYQNLNPKSADDAWVLQAFFAGVKGSVIDLGEHLQSSRITRNGMTTTSIVQLMTNQPNACEWPNPLLSYGNASFSSPAFVPVWALSDYDEFSKIGGETYFTGDVRWYGHLTSETFFVPFSSVSVQQSAVPEPSSLGLLALSAFGLLKRRR